MAFLNIAGTDMRVLQDLARELKPRLKGGRQAAEDNTMLSSERTPKRNFTCQVLFGDSAEADAFLDLISVTGNRGAAKAVDVTSQADGLTRSTDILSCYVDMGELQPFQWGGSAEIPAGVYWVSTLAIEQK